MVEQGRTDEEIATLSAQVEANRYLPDLEENSKPLVPPLSHQDSGISDSDSTDSER